MKTTIQLFVAVAIGFGVCYWGRSYRAKQEMRMVAAMQRGFDRGLSNEVRRFLGDTNVASVTDGTNMWRTNRSAITNYYDSIHAAITNLTATNLVIHGNRFYDTNGNLLSTGSIWLPSRSDTEGMANALCAIRGHRWGDNPNYTAGYSTNPAFSRKCAVCDLVQSKQPGEWK